MDRNHWPCKGNILNFSFARLSTNFFAPMERFRGRVHSMNANLWPFSTPIPLRTPYYLLRARNFGSSFDPSPSCTYKVHSPVLQCFVLILKFEVQIPSKNYKWWCNFFQVRNVKLFVRSGLWGDPSSMQLYSQLSFGGLRRISKHLLRPQTYMHVKNPNGNRKIQSGKPRTW